MYALGRAHSASQTVTSEHGALVSVPSFVVRIGRSCTEAGVAVNFLDFPLQVIIPPLFCCHLSPPLRYKIGLTGGILSHPWSFKLWASSLTGWLNVTPAESSAGSLIIVHKLLYYELTLLSPVVLRGLRLSPSPTNNTQIVSSKPSPL